MLAVVACAVAVLVVAVATTLLWLIVRALWQAGERRRHQAFAAGAGAELTAVVGVPAAEDAWVARARAVPPEILRRALERHLTRTTGAYHDGVARLHRRLGLVDRDVAALASRRLGRRMRALRRLVGVAGPEQREAIMRLVDATGEARYLVAQIIGRVGVADDVVTLLARWPVRSRLGEYPIHVMIDELRPDALDALVRRRAELGSDVARRIVLIAAARVAPRACLPWLAEAAHDPSLELRIGACRAAALMASETTATLLRTLVADPAWEVRAQAVKALGAHPSASSRALLCERLGDASFWVRQNAAAALGRQGADGRASLREVAEHATDRFARDAATHVLMDLALAPSLPIEVPV